MGQVGRLSEQARFPAVLAHKDRLMNRDVGHGTIVALSLRERTAARCRATIRIAATTRGIPLAEREGYETANFAFLDTLAPPVRMARGDRG
jgi:hypothetical protein